MTMDYGGSRLADRSMYENAVSAAEAAHRQLTGLYRDAGGERGSETVWRKIGLTPMIGQNDIQGEIFTLKDAEELSAYASAKGVGRLSMWSLNRDRTCSPNYPDVKQVSDGCSGVEQGSATFATILRAGVSGLSGGAGSPAVPAASPQPSKAPVDYRRSVQESVPGVERNHRLHQRRADRLALECLRGQVVDPRRHPG